MDEGKCGRDMQGYYRSLPELQKWGLELVDKLGLRGDERVLDIGSGYGQITAEIAHRLPRGGDVVGIDNSPDMVDFAAKSFSPAGYPNLTFIVMDAADLKFDREFDIVFSSATLHRIANHLPVLQGIDRSLKAGGRVLLQMAGAGAAADLFDTVHSVMRADAWQPYFRKFASPWGFYGPEEYRFWLQETQLEPLRLELILKDMLHKGKEDFADWFSAAWLPYTQMVPQERRNGFVEEVVSRYVENNLSGRDGMVHTKMVRLEVDLVKRVGG
jgi:trans-aconitate 2-methyltransferase